MIAGDMRQHTHPQYTSRQYFAGACEAMADIGPGDFMITTGDTDPPKNAIETVKSFLGEEFPVYAVVGNHDIPGHSIETYAGENIKYFRHYNAGGDKLPHIVRHGPVGSEETTYSFDYQNSHFVVLNVYYDGKSDFGINGDVCDSLYNWLAEDLAQTDKKHIFVIGHEPAFYHPDYDKGYLPLPEDYSAPSSNNDLGKYPAHRNRFWNLLVQNNVTAYFCGHYHSFSAYQHDGVWQVVCGHARGIVEHFKSTFVKVTVNRDSVKYQAFRDNHDGWPYRLAYSGTLNSAVQNHVLKGMVWNDSNSDSEPSEHERAMQGIRVLLTTPNDSKIKESITAVDGMFVFDSLSPGQYKITIDFTTLPENMICSTQNLPLEVEIKKKEFREISKIGFKKAFESSFTIALTSDMRRFCGDGSYDTPLYFRGVCEAIAQITDTAFMISPGDEDPPSFVRWTLDQYLGASYLWYPAVGNHELPSETFEFYPDMKMDFLRNYNKNAHTLPYIVNSGPPGCEETTYSFDYQNAHFAIINQYYDGKSDIGTDGDVVDELFSWLKADLKASRQNYKFVIGHEPAFPRPDADNGLLRHEHVCLDKYPQNRDRFWQLLVEENVVAYITAHTHCYSLYQHQGVWQLDCGHARGLTPKKKVKSTFILLTIGQNQVSYQTYRDNYDGGPYNLSYSGVLATSEPVGSIGNLVWYDLNRDGMQSENEKGIPKVKLVLINAVGDTVAKTITDQKGQYAFNNITAGSYWLYIDKTSIPHSIDKGKPNALSHQLNLVGNEDYLEADFGLQKAKEKIVYAFERLGWNLISLPGKTDDMHVTTIFPEANPALTMTYEDNHYIQVDTLEVGRAYWIFVIDPFQVEVQIDPVNSIHRRFNKPGWHLLGSPYGQYKISRVNPDEAILPVLMSYDNVTGKINSADQLEATKGYWILVRKPCDIYIEN